MFHNRIFITGCSGLLGFNLSLFLHEIGYKNIIGQYFESKSIPAFLECIKLDLREKSDISSFFHSFDPDVIINCAALTNVDTCEQTADNAFTMNAGICENIVNLIKNKNTRIIHISTDQLWDGSQKFVTEKTNVCPINVYGRSKHKGETYIKKHNNHIIVRTNFFGGDLPWRRSFLGWVEDHLSNQKEINAFNDIYITPIALPILLQHIGRLISTQHTGIFHLGGSERISKYQLALEYAKLKGLNIDLIKQCTSTEYPLLAKRPSEMSIDSSAFEKIFGLKLPNINQSLLAAIEYAQRLSSLKIF